jgi:hypothetical protein
LPYSGPASAYGVIGDAEAAYFNKGIISTTYLKDLTDPAWKDDPGDQHRRQGLFPIEQMQLMKFDGESWRLFGEVIDGKVGH